MPRGFELLGLAALLGIVIGTFLRRSQPRMYKPVLIAGALLLCVAAVLYVLRAR